MKKFISTILTLIMLLSMITITQAADFSGGGYNFVCVDGGRYLNVYAGKDADGTNVCVWEKDGSPEQNYTISSCGGGKYKLYPASSSSRVIDVNRGNSYNNPLKAGLNVDLWRTNDAPAQEFYITHVGNNLYKIELAALSGHVLQANNPNKNNGNVTLERYTSASNQHWKILKNGTQVTERCTHNSVSAHNERTSYEQKNDSAHTAIKTYDSVCNDCGKTIKSNVTETTTENHSISNNKCSKCGYEVITQKCTHAKTYENVKSYVVAQKNDTYHTVTDTYDVYCSDCDELIKKDLTRTYDEKHTISDDICKKCSYAVPGSETARCKHTNTAKHMSENMKSVTSIKDDNQHTTVSYYNLYCADCQTYIEYDIPEIADEDHKFVNNICSACNLEKIVEKPESTTIAASKTTFTPGETISLTWPQADRATSYDIHIEKPGVDTPYRIDSGFSGTSGTVVINDEGTYRLAIYPINSSGYIRGSSVTVTVKKASTDIKSKYQSIVNNIGWQTKKAYSNWDYMCGCYATAYAHSYISGKIHKPSEYWKSASDATTYWTRAGGNRTTKSNNNQVLAAVKSEIDKGKPCVIRVNSSYGGHYVLVITYTGNGNRTSDFTVIDPWDGKFKSLSNFTIHSSNKQVIVF